MLYYFKHIAIESKINNAKGMKNWTVNLVQM